MRGREGGKNLGPISEAWMQKRESEIEDETVDQISMM
jgi:hypothetical protein